MRFLHRGVIVAISMALVVTGSPLLTPAEQDLASTSSALVNHPSSSSLEVSPHVSVNAKSHKKKNKKSKKKKGYRKTDCQSYNDTPDNDDNGDKNDYDDGKADHDHDKDGDHDKDDYDHGEDNYDDDDDYDDDYDDYDCYPIPDPESSESAPPAPRSTEPPGPSDGDSSDDGDSDEQPVEIPAPSDGGSNSGGDSDEEPAEPPTPTEYPSSTHDILPVSSPYYLPDFGASDFTPKEEIPRGPIERGTVSFNIQSYPDIWAIPSGDHEEVQAAVAAINWKHVPNAPIRTAQGTGDLYMKDYDVGEDEHCWWSATGCFKPKVPYLPEDAHICSEPGDWGLTFDDGPLNPRKIVIDQSPDGIDEYAEPYLYNFLADQNQRATLFYVGSNVVTYPEAAKRAFDSGHHLCLHTWSHVPMTTLTNEQVVAELYWNLRAIKEATGATSRCWRPPFGDVDDRVRAIAHQMGLTTVLWSKDSQDWQMTSMSNEGKLGREIVDGYFQQWVDERYAGNDTHGHIVLQHELNEETIGMAEKWLPQLKEAFNVKPIHECTPAGKPYWEMGSSKSYLYEDKENEENDEEEGIMMKE